MAFVGLLRSTSWRTIACQGHTLQNVARLNSTSPSLLSAQLMKTMSKNQHIGSGTTRLQTFSKNQTQFFSCSPKTYSAGAGHNHSKLWTLERALGAALIVIVPAALASPCKALDTLAAASLVVHTHWGLEANVVDYVRPIMFGKFIPKVALGAVYALSIVTFAGLLQLIYTDIGLANTVRKIWRL